MPVGRMFRRPSQIRLPHGHPIRAREFSNVRSVNSLRKASQSRAWHQGINCQGHISVNFSLLDANDRTQAVIAGLERGYTHLGKPA
jgi:xanthine/CO dehydrogenase XdhC/CoxF family maturation factor